LSPFDLIPQRDFREKLVNLVLNGVPGTAGSETAVLLKGLRDKLLGAATDRVRVVVFGGGTGLSNIIGGDCRQAGWEKHPFVGLKQLFPETKSIVCITDDGGSTGEIMKDVPVIGLGDIRHVMLSSIQAQKLEALYGLSRDESLRVVANLSHLFNFRFSNQPESAEMLLQQCGVQLAKLPGPIAHYVQTAINFCFSDSCISQTLRRKQCLGNLLILAAIRQSLGEKQLTDRNLELDEVSSEAVYEALSCCAEMFGAGRDGVLPSSVTPAQLRFQYTDGVQVTGEEKSSLAERGFPVDKVVVDFCGTPFVSERVFKAIGSADILILAPGSLYSSIIPVLQVPGIAQAIRNNKQALKLLISNLWVQAGETDRSISDPERKFYVSDMIRAYDRNIPGGIAGLFDYVLCLSLQDVPASVIQNYTVEGKIPIYLDRYISRNEGFEPIECGFYSRQAMQERQVIQHDPVVVAQTVKALYLANQFFPSETKRIRSDQGGNAVHQHSRTVSIPSGKYDLIHSFFTEIPVFMSKDNGDTLGEAWLRSALVDIIWAHQDIPISHLDNIRGVACIKQTDWIRDQRWDNVFSFYDPADGLVKIRQDRFESMKNLEIAFLITVGQSLLGNYAARKVMEPLRHDGKKIGGVYHLHLREAGDRNCYFTDQELCTFLDLARMVPQGVNHFTRVVNGEERFTPPGLLMGLMYIWYLDNRFASHIEYKMSIMKIQQTDLIPDQKMMRGRREQMTMFFSESVFGKGYARTNNQ
jgi:uncharacterized cofD-like protein